MLAFLSIIVAALTMLWFVWVMSISFFDVTARHLIAGIVLVISCLLLATNSAKGAEHSIVVTPEVPSQIEYIPNCRCNPPTLAPLQEGVNAPSPNEGKHIWVGVGCISVGILLATLLIVRLLSSPYCYDEDQHG